MATTDLPFQAELDRETPAARRASGADSSAWRAVKTVLTPLASLKVTVVLLAMATFIVLAGTLAQAEMGIERVVQEYFRVLPWGPTLGFAWIPFQVFFPESFFPNGRPIVGGGFWFPGGWLIGLAMFVNLLAAHTVRFTTSARGLRLAVGLGIIALGAIVTWAVVATGTNVNGVQDTPVLSWQALWRLFQAQLVLLAMANIAGAAWLLRSPTGSRRNGWIAVAALPITLGLTAWALFVPDVGESSMRILWQLIKATMAALVLLAGCWIVFRKRAGIVLLHAGVGLLMISELLVGLLAKETQMLLREGETRAWAQDIRTPELAVVDPSNPEHDVVTRIPATKLKEGDALAHESIPFQVRIDKFYRNATIVAGTAKEGTPSVRLTGGKEYVIEERPEVAGTSTDGGVDHPAAQVTLLAKDGSTIGTYLRSALLETSDYADEVTVDGKKWVLDLRFRRDYKPYAITLIDVRKDDYVGTDTPKNYSSDIRVVSKELGADFERKVWMNNPLRFAGETLYQSGYHRLRGGEATTLQIVKNTGWMLPYVACMVVVVGMAAQFLVTLSRFLGRRAEMVRFDVPASVAEVTPATPAGRYGWLVPTLVVLLFAAWLGSKFAPPRSKPTEPDLVAFGELPVASQGRVKPIDSVARDALKALSNNRQTFKIGDDREPAIRWLLDFIADPAKGETHRVIRVDNDPLLSALELPRDREGFMYSVKEIREKRDALVKLAGEVRSRNQDGKQPSADDRAVLELERKFGVFLLIEESFIPPVESPQEIERFVTQGGGVRAIQLYNQWYDLQKNGDMTARPAVPSRNPPLALSYEGIWETLGHGRFMEALRKWAGSQGGPSIEADPAVAAWTKILGAWKEGDVTGFNAAVKSYQASLAAEPPKDYRPGRIGFEAYFNHAEPFYYLMFPYVVAGLLGACSWLGWSRPLNRTAFWLTVFAFALHTLALIGRIYISGRPPITNLYGSAVFVGWAGVAFGLGLERVYRLGFGNVLAGVMGAAGLLIAHGLSKDGSDTFSVLQAVLDTQFWLATHVVIINLGYAAVAAAGCLGLLYIVLGFATPLLGERVGRSNAPTQPTDVLPGPQRMTDPRSQTVGQALIRMTYGTLCFGMLFSFFGTVLGGLWADDSWGRFWGWDPKENGALIIVLWTALVLHARWGGMVKDRGLAVLAVGGNVAVAWSWFGTNQLGVGLHAYGGFAGTVLLALALFVTSQLFVIVAGCLPKAFWVSFRQAPVAAA